MKQLWKQWIKPQPLSESAYHQQVKQFGYAGQRQKDWIRFFVMLFIFGVFTFLFLSVFQGEVSFELSIFTIRIWEWMLAVFGGGALGVAGFLLQKVTRNNLADVSILGIGSLNIIFITIYIFRFYHDGVSNQELVRQFLPLITISSSILGTGIIYALAKLGQKSQDRFIIIGIGLQFLFEAISIAFVNPNNSGASSSKTSFVFTQINNFALGKFPTEINELAASFSWKLTTLASVVLICLIVGVVWILRRKIDIIEANENLAKSYGINVELIKFVIYFLVALLAGVEAAMIGTIALLGILAPNIAKIIFGNRSSTNVWASFLIGGSLVLLAAFISVNLVLDIPIGFLSTAVITPYFIYMIIRKRD